VAVTNRLLAASGHESRIQFRVIDVLNIDARENDGRCQGIISAMLAEHLPDPALLFGAMSSRIATDGIVFFSTALESPQRDQVFEFNQESQPLEMAEDAGLRVTRLMSDASAAASGYRFLPRATAMILRPHLTASRK
jgi:2-polyprenyl-3-methyl-5-hydroxy-6-metoxy-1,4-benzoquinol methylase